MLLFTGRVFLPGWREHLLVREKHLLARRVFLAPRRVFLPVRRVFPATQEEHLPGQEEFPVARREHLLREKELLAEAPEDMAARQVGFYREHEKRGGNPGGMLTRAVRRSTRKLTRRRRANGPFTGSANTTRGQRLPPDRGAIMANDWLPTKNAELATFATTFGGVATTLAEDIGITPAMAALYVTLAEDFVTKLAATTNHATNSRTAGVEMRSARELLVAETRKLARIIQAHPATTDAQRSDLGLPIWDTHKDPRNVPSKEPVLEVMEISGHLVKIRLRDKDNPTSRAKPTNAYGARIYSYVGETAPATIAGWDEEGSTTRTLTTVAISGAVPAGSKVWLSAQWFNWRMETGPACDAVGLSIGGGISAVA